MIVGQAFRPVTELPSGARPRHKFLGGLLLALRILHE